MSAFTEKEIEYLQDQRLGRLATVNREGEPHVVPVAFRYNEEMDAIDIGGHNFARSKKYRDARDTGLAAFVVDDVELRPWRARGVEVRGRAEVHGEGGEEVGPGFDADVVRIFPERIVEWGLDSGAYRPNSRSVDEKSA
jgi:pyridoxamine 5'-phosphate oxidase family protein